MGGRLLTGLIEGYGGQMLQVEDRAHKEAQATKKNRLDVLKSVFQDENATPEAREEAFKMMGEILSEKGGKGGKGKKGGFNLGALVGKFDKGDKSNVGEELTKRVAARGVTPSSAQPQGQESAEGKTSQPAGDLGKIPTRPAAAPSLGEPPARPSLFKTPQQITDEEINRAARVHAAQQGWKREDAEKAMAYINEGKTPQEKEQRAAVLGIQLPQKHLQRIQVTSKDKPGEPFYASYDPASGAIYQLGTDVEIPDAKPYNPQKPSYQTLLGPDGKPHKYQVDPSTGEKKDLGLAPEKNGVYYDVDPITGEKTPHIFNAGYQGAKGEGGLGEIPKRGDKAIPVAAKGKNAKSKREEILAGYVKAAREGNISIVPQKARGVVLAEMGKQGIDLPTKLSAQAKQTIGTARGGIEMADQLLEALDKPGPNGKSLIQEDSVTIQAQLLYQWGRYKLGQPITDPRMEAVIAPAALLRVVLTTPYLRGLRNFQYVQQIQQHIPGPTDSPQLMKQKITQLRKNIPLLLDAIYRSEGAAPQGDGQAQKKTYNGYEYTKDPSTGEWVRGKKVE